MNRIYTYKMGILDYFKKKEPEKTPKIIELSKIDKHLNLLLREKLSSKNKTIQQTIEEIENIKNNTEIKLKELHKKKLINPNIPLREIQIMEGNRDNYIKNTKNFLKEINIPQQYLQIYEYTVEILEKLENLSKTNQKSHFILKGFFDNEIKEINKNLKDIEEKITQIRILFEKQKISTIKEIYEDVEKIKKNYIKIKHIEHEIKENEAVIKEYEDKIKKINEKIETIKTGTDYRTLENFKQEKEKTETEIKKIFQDFDSKFTEIQYALKKFYYKNPDKKIIKNYIEEPYKTLINDDQKQIINIIKDLKEDIENIDLKERKKETIIEYLNKLTPEYIDETQLKLKKLEDLKQDIQAKIIHNSSSLNISEQEYWIKTNKEKINIHTEKILKLEEDNLRLNGENTLLKKKIKKDLELLVYEEVTIIDDLRELFENKEH
ncbi:MAG: hypothetical protein QXK76_01420 [Candidatus Woesearchaeota archaeon]